MVTHAYAEAARHPVEDGGEDDGLPTPEEERKDGAGMKKNHEKSGGPVDLCPRLVRRGLILFNIPQCVPFDIH
jgi:hypothetical protein